MRTAPARRVALGDGDDPLHVLTRPGDYCGPTGRYSPEPKVFFLLPFDRLLTEGESTESNRVGPTLHGLHHVSSPPHTFRECPDGSLEIRESILAYGIGHQPVWHGYLDEGNTWREC